MPQPPTVVTIALQRVERGLVLRMAHVDAVGRTAVSSFFLTAEQLATLLRIGAVA